MYFKVHFKFILKFREHMKYIKPPSWFFQYLLLSLGGKSIFCLTRQVSNRFTTNHYYYTPHKEMNVNIIYRRKKRDLDIPW